MLGKGAWYTSVLYFRCAIPGLDNDTYAIQNEFHQRLVNLTIPPAVPNDDDDVYDKCRMYEYTHTDMLVFYDVYKATNLSSIPNRTSVTCEQWVYDDSVFTSTLAAEVIISKILHACTVILKS